MAFKKFLENTTQLLGGPAQRSYDEESLSEPPDYTVSDESFDDSVESGDSDSDSE